MALHEASRPNAIFPRNQYRLPHRPLCGRLRQGRGGALHHELSRTAALLEKMHPPSPPAISPFASMGQQPAVLPLCLNKSTGWCLSALSILRLRGGCRTLKIEARGRERCRLTMILLTLVKAGRGTNTHTTPTSTLPIENTRAMNMCRLHMTNLVHLAAIP